MIQESSNIRSLEFSDGFSRAAKPGQFVMIWLPAVGEFPMSASLTHGDNCSITVKAMGAGSKELYEAPRGSVIGVRGPYGVPFDTTRAKRILLIGGGTGMAPMILLANELTESKKASVKIVIGARSRGELPFLKAATKFLGKSNVFPTTDDGSLGFRGMAHQKVSQLVDESKFDLICSCGPEAMMNAVYEIAKSKMIPVQFSLERIMKCGMGICGSCCIGELVLCKDGPVLKDEDIRTVSKEFGHFERNKSGMLVAK